MTVAQENESQAENPLHDQLREMGFKVIPAAEAEQRVLLGGDGLRKWGESMIGQEPADGGEEQGDGPDPTAA